MGADLTIGGKSSTGLRKGRGIVEGMTAETASLLNRFAVRPTVARAVLINNLIVSLKAAGVWQTLDCWYELSASDQDTARLNWAQDQYNLVEVESGTLGFAVDRGFTGDGVGSYLDSRYDSGMAGAKLTQDSGHIGVWSLSGGQESANAVGNTTTSIAPRTTSDAIAVRGNSGSTDTFTGITDGSGYSVISRADAAGFNGYKNGVDLGNKARASSALSSRDFYVCAWGAATPQYSTRQLALAHWGSALTAQQVAAVYAAQSAYLAGVGAI